MPKATPRPPPPPVRVELVGAADRIVEELANAELSLIPPDETVRQCNMLVDTIGAEQEATRSESGADPASLRRLAAALRQSATTIGNVAVEDEALIELRDDYAKLSGEIADVSEKAAAAIDKKKTDERADAAKQMSALGSREASLLNAINDHCQKAYAQPDPAAEAACLKGVAERCVSAGAHYDTHEAHYDERRALELYLRGCDRHDAKSCASAAVAHGTGRGVARNDERATELHARACKLGLADSCAAVAEALWDEDRTPRHEEVARKLWRSACGAGEGRACAQWLEHGGDDTRTELDALCERGNARACEALDR